MTDPMAGLDSWLEAPYVDAARYSDEYEQWCENEGIDPEGDNYAAFEKARDDAMEAAMSDAADRREDERDEAACDRAEARYEAHIYGED